MQSGNSTDYIAPQNCSRNRKKFASKGVNTDSFRGLYGVGIYGVWPYRHKKLHAIWLPPITYTVYV